MRTGTIVALLMLVGLLGAYAQPNAEGGKGRTANAADKPSETPLGSTSTASLPANPDPQEVGATAGGVSVHMAETESVSVNLGMVNDIMKNVMARRGPWMSSPEAAPDALSTQLGQQLLVTNSLVAQLLAIMTSSSAPKDVVKSQLQLLNQLLANQAAMLQLLAGSAGGGAGKKMGGR
jgi:hypothetical protein